MISGIPDVGDDPGNLSTRDKSALDADQALAGQCAAKAAIAPFLTLFDFGQGMRFASD